MGHGFGRCRERERKKREREKEAADSWESVGMIEPRLDLESFSVLD
jgi:hypothetical protein